MNAGYIMQFEDHGQFDPNGKVSPAIKDVTAHNAALDKEIIAAMLLGEKVVLYLTDRTASTWAGTFKFPCHFVRKSWHNFAGKDGRTDVWFTGPDGNNWHGVNIGDSQILRCHRLKTQ